MKKFLFILLFLLAISPIYSQQKSDYVVLLNNDTTLMSESKIKPGKIICKVNGIKTKYNAEDVLAYKVGNEIGETGKVHPTLIGFKRWIFLERKIVGKISLYEITMWESNLNHTGATNSGATKRRVVFYRKMGEPQREFHKGGSWGALTGLLSDCPKFVEKLNSKDSFDKVEVMFEYYNAHCN